LVLGRVNASSIYGGPSRVNSSHFSREAWAYYLKALPGQVGVPLLILALLGVAAVMFGSAKTAKPFTRLLLCWMGIGYAWFTLIALHETRHDVFILLPLAVFVVLGFRGLLPARIAPAVVVLVGAGIFTYTLLSQQVPYIRGYREAARMIAGKSPQGGVILFSGYRDGSFIFNLRQQTQLWRFAVLRSDKLLLRLSVGREEEHGGVQDRGLGTEEIARLMREYKIAYLVLQQDFWSDLPGLRNLTAVAHSGAFEKVGEIPVQGNIGHADQKVEIYKSTSDYTGGPLRYDTDLSLIGRSIHGQIWIR
jgi:hypothetical protein